MVAPLLLLGHVALAAHSSTPPLPSQRDRPSRDMGAGRWTMPDDQRLGARRSVLLFRERTRFGREASMQPLPRRGLALRRQRGQGW